MCSIELSNQTAGNKYYVLYVELFRFVSFFEYDLELFEKV